jgi:hypothetical protein
MKPAEPSTSERSCPKSWAWVVSILVGLHLLAVVSEPLRFFSQSDFQAGPEFFALRGWVAPYVDWLYLDHGYFFFAPNPGPSHLVAVESDASKGSAPAADASQGVQLSRYAYVFPDRRRQWPRLLYHRYFMLSEFYNNSFVPDRLLEEDMSDRELVERWRGDRGRYERLGASLERSLSKELGLDRVVVRRLERILPSPDQVLREGWKLNDPRGLILLEEGPRPIPPSLPSLPPTIAAPPQQQQGVTPP